MQQKFLCENYLQQDLHKKSTVFLYFSYTVKQKKKKYAELKKSITQNSKFFNQPRII